MQLKLAPKWMICKEEEDDWLVGWMIGQKILRGEKDGESRRESWNNLGELNEWGEEANDPRVHLWKCL